MIKQFIADAFTDKVFHGNPAAICLPERWPDEKLMQDIASENRLSETAFVVKENNGWKLRWFTPGGEIDLCGHATLATAFVLMNFVEPDLSEIEFSILSGKLSTARSRRPPLFFRNNLLQLAKASVSPCSVAFICIRRKCDALFCSHVHHLTNSPLPVRLPQLKILSQLRFCC